MASPSAVESISSPPSLTSDATPGSQAPSPGDTGPQPAASLPITHQSAPSQSQSALNYDVNINGKIALPPQPQTISATTTMGPASKIYTIPPRPKPGRKPKEPTADDVRKEQNRAAQKKFRNKQNDKIQILTEELGQKNAANDSLKIELNNLNLALTNTRVQMETMRQQLLVLESERASEKAAFKRQAEEMKRESKRRRTAHSGSDGDIHFDYRNGGGPTGLSIPSSDSITSATPGNPTPPYEMEIDFTNFGQPADGGNDDCGFCEGGDFCACTMKIKAPTADSLETAPAPPPSVVPLKRGRSTAPGTCDACQRDPEQARKCQELAKESKFSPTPPTPGTVLGVKTGPGGLLNEPAPERTSCSDFLAKFRPLDTSQYRSIIGNLHSFPHMDQLGRGNGPALDLDAKEAAEALTSLATRSKRY